MDAALFIKVAAVLLGVAASVGLSLAGIRLAGEPYPPAALAMGHGLLAGAALTLLVFAAFTVGLPTAAALGTAILLAGAAIGVWLNLGFHARRKPIPLGAMTAHILIAVAGVAVLLGALIAF